MSPVSLVHAGPLIEIRPNFYFIFIFYFFNRKMSLNWETGEKIEMSKRNFEHSLRIIILIVCGSCHVAPWRPPCVSGFQCLTHLPCLSVLLLQVFLFFSLFSKSKTIVWGKSLLFTKQCVWVKLYFFQWMTIFLGWAVFNGLWNKRK